MKVFYKRQTWTPLQPGEPESASIEDVPFPEELFEELSKALEEGKALLPVNARMFQGWEVGLLERFEIQDVRGAIGRNESSDPSATESG
jgi:ubiquitin-protein ligase E3 D